MTDKDLVHFLQDVVPKEIIDGQDIAEIGKTYVILDVAYKPVIRECVTQDDIEMVHYIPAVIDVVRTRRDCNYELHWTNGDGHLDFVIVSPDELKVMRARYIAVLNYYRKNWHRITRPDQQAILNQYDIGFVPDPDSELGKMLRREV